MACTCACAAVCVLPLVCTHAPAGARSHATRRGRCPPGRHRWQTCRPCPAASFRTRTASWHCSKQQLRCSVSNMHQRRRQSAAADHPLLTSQASTWSQSSWGTASPPGRRRCVRGRQQRMHGSAALAPSAARGALQCVRGLADAAAATHPTCVGDVITFIASGPPWRCCLQIQSPSLKPTSISCTLDAFALQSRTAAPKGLAPWCLASPASEPPPPPARPASLHVLCPCPPLTCG